MSSVSLFSFVSQDVCQTAFQSLRSEDIRTVERLLIQNKSGPRETGKRIVLSASTFSVPINHLKYKILKTQNTVRSGMPSQAYSAVTIPSAPESPRARQQRVGTLVDIFSSIFSFQSVIKHISPNHMGTTPHLYIPKSPNTVACVVSLLCAA